jgi:hypothetical protein
LGEGVKFGVLARGGGAGGCFFAAGLICKGVDKGPARLSFAALVLAEAGGTFLGAVERGPESLPVDRLAGALCGGALVTGVTGTRGGGTIAGVLTCASFSACPAVMARARSGSLLGSVLSAGTVPRFSALTG